MKKKLLFLFTILLFVTVILIVYLSGSGLKPEYEWRAHPMALEIPLTDNNEQNFYLSTISESTGAAIGEFKSFYYNGIYNWEFIRKEVLYGDVPDETIKIVRSRIDDFGFSIDEDTFTEGNNYLLFLVRDDSVFLDSPQYGLMGQVCIPVDDFNNSTWSRGKISYGYGISFNDIKNYYRDMALNKGFDTDPVKITVFRNENLETVFKNSDAVFRIKIVGNIIDGTIVPQSNYEILILDALKGNNLINTVHKNYIVHAEKNSMSVNNEYIIALSVNNLQSTHSSFTQSALNGIIPIEDKETVAQVYTWLGLKEPVTE